jgi:hypothetical protein
MITVRQLLHELGQPLTEWAWLNYEVVFRDEDSNLYELNEVLSVDESSQEKKIYLNILRTLTATDSHET